MEEQEIPTNGGKPVEQEPATEISEVDRLTAENLQLKLMNLVLQRKEKIREAEILGAEINELQKAYAVLREEIVKRYQIDLANFEIEAGSGKIVPVGSTKRGPLR